LSRHLRSLGGYSDPSDNFMPNSSLPMIQAAPTATAAAANSAWAAFA
jgi:hypothetical protein